MITFLIQLSMKVLVLRDITTLKDTLVSLKFISFLSIDNYMILKDVWPIMNKWTPLSTILLRTTTIEKWTPIITGGNNHSIAVNYFLFFSSQNWNFMTCPPSKLIFFCFDCDFNLIFFALIAALIGRTCREKLVKSHLKMTTHHALVNTI